MRIRLVLPALMASMVAFSAWAREPVETPDMDMLEYLGTYETARGKDIDPMSLEKTPVESPRSKAATPKKIETKKNEPRKKENEDD